MNKIIDFPEKVFPEWGAIAQEIAPYLKKLGATKEETQGIIDKVKRNWEQLGMPPASEPSSVERSKIHDEKISLLTQQFDSGTAHGARHWKSESARTLIALAKFEYRVSLM